MTKRIKAAGSSETPVTTDMTIQCSNADYRNVDWLKSPKFGDDDVIKQTRVLDIFYRLVVVK
jgi:hypothetical protein